ncbi:hypothetical protein ACGFX8_02535 [Streptomyces sp. NPDC048362]|uniref:hypothetical protein n=1 Tax=Streptomyces sp. NPDC048362 TaxID=3365539 RepID=UPI003723F43C
MRPCTSASLCLAAAAVLVTVPAAAAHADATPSCAASGDRAFPLATRIRGGPGTYEAGGGFGTWYIDLTNTTHDACADIHPVVVLVDDRRALRPDQADLDFSDGSRSLPVELESTDEQELVGVLDGEGFDGFTVPAGRTVSVRVRLALAADAGSEHVTVNAAAVQRRGDDGNWVGESNAYRFAIDGQRPAPEATDPDATPDTEESGGAHASPTGGAPQASPSAGPRSTASGGPKPSLSGGPRGTPSATATPVADTSLPFAADAQAAGERARELARTGAALAHGLLAAAAVLLCVAGTAFLLARRRR